MQGSQKLVASFVAGAVLASLPYTLSLGKTSAQVAGPGGPPVQGGPTPGGPPPGGFGQGMPPHMGFAPITAITQSGDYVYAGAGNFLYKVNANTMTVERATALNPPQRAPRQKPNPGGGIGSGDSFKK